MVRLCCLINLSMPDRLQGQIGEPPSRLSVWRITLAGHDIHASLESKHLKSFDTHGVASTQCVSFRGDLFARALRMRPGHYVEIYRWKQSTSTVHCKASICPVDLPVRAY